jgi:hypothetical protein
MHFTLSDDEVAIVKDQKKRLPKNNCSLSKDTLYVSASNWGEEHLRALRVTHIDDLPLERFFDAEHIPQDDGTGELYEQEKVLSIG